MEKRNIFVALAGIAAIIFVLSQVAPKKSDRVAAAKNLNARDVSASAESSNINKITVDIDNLNALEKIIYTRTSSVEETNAREGNGMVVRDKTNLKESVEKLRSYIRTPPAAPIFLEKMLKLADYEQIAKCAMLSREQYYYTLQTGHINDANSDGQFAVALNIAAFEEGYNEYEKRGAPMVEKRIEYIKYLSNPANNNKFHEENDQICLDILIKTKIGDGSKRDDN
jgi:hypothetical protein